MHRYGLVESLTWSLCLAARWQKPNPNGGGPLGDAVLRSRGLFTQYFYVWLGVIVLIAFVLLFNALLLLAMTYLDRESSLLIGVLDFTVRQLMTLQNHIVVLA